MLSASVDVGLQAMVEIAVDNGLQRLKNVGIMEPHTIVPAES